MKCINSVMDSSPRLSNSRVKTLGHFNETWSPTPLDLNAIDMWRDMFWTRRRVGALDSWSSTVTTTLYIVYPTCWRICQMYMYWLVDQTFDSSEWVWPSIMVLLAIRRNLETCTTRDQCRSSTSLRDLSWSWRSDLTFAIQDWSWLNDNPLGLSWRQGDNEIAVAKPRRLWWSHSQVVPARTSLTHWFHV